MYLIHETKRVHTKDWPLRHVVASVIETLVREGSLRKKLERLGVLHTQTFGDGETVEV